MSKKVTILGGGPAGLGCAYYAQKNEVDFELYEGSPHLGGNCRTLTYGDFKYDTGAHRFHDKLPEITSEIKQLMGEELKLVTSPSQIYFNNKFIDFPLSPLNLIKAYGVKNFFKSGIEITSAKFNKKAVENFYDYSVKKYGKTLAEKLLLNYSEKLWGIDPRSLTPTVSGGRLKGLNLFTFIIESLFKKNAKVKHLDGSFYYPKNGYGSLSEKLVQHAGQNNIHTRQLVTGVDMVDNTITAIQLNQKDFSPTQTVINTIPLPKLIQILPQKEVPQAVLAASRAITFRHIILVSIFLDTPSITSNASMYFPEEGFPFTRITEPRNRSHHMSPQGKTSLIVEIPSDSTIVPDNITTTVTKKLLELNFFTPKQIIKTTVDVLPYAYPVLSNANIKHIDTIKNYIKKIKNLHQLGRSGNMEYTHFHNHLADAHEIIMKIT